MNPPAPSALRFAAASAAPPARLPAPASMPRKPDGDRPTEKSNRLPSRHGKAFPCALNLQNK
jgi:hypothetical protein